MSLKKSIESLNLLLEDSRDSIKNEESTKQFLILPFINGLGYNTFSPNEVTPEFTADFHKKNEKVDYAIFINGEPKIFVEAKPIASNLTRSVPQLSRYFSTFPSVKIGILTNGVEYHFFSDSKNKNIMDNKPFFTFDITNFNSEDFSNLSKFTKGLYDDSEVRYLSESLSFFKDFKRSIKENLESPSEDFIKFIIKERSKTKVTQQLINSSRPLIEKAIEEIISELSFQPTGSPKLNLEEEEAREKNSRYTPEQLDSLYKIEELDGVNIVLPNHSLYSELLNIDESEYSVKKGNPSSDFFVASIAVQGNETIGYLIGQYINDKEDVTLYTARSSEIGKFLDENPILKENGFINAKLASRINKENNKIKYYHIRSCLNDLPFDVIPNLVSSEAAKFFIWMYNARETREKYK